VGLSEAEVERAGLGGRLGRHPAVRVLGLGGGQDAPARAGANRLDDAVVGVRARLPDRVDVHKLEPAVRAADDGDYHGRPVACGQWQLACD